MSEQIIESPFAKYGGELLLGDKSVECYVLDDGRRVITMRAAVKSISGTEGGNLASYINAQIVKARLPDAIQDTYIDFLIRGNPQRAKGMQAETFLEICQAYVGAYSFEPENMTSRQKEIAMNCAILLSACAKVGLIALIDEATGYQYDRSATELQVKLQAYIAEELRDWEKTFPDELWEEFGRLTNWSGPLTSRPKYWGKLVYELIYQALDPDIATYLKENKPKPTHGSNYHQWLTEDIGVKALVTHINQVIGIAKTCDNMAELKAKIGHIFKKEPLQTSFFLPDNAPE